MDRQTRYDEKLIMILDRASEVIALKGYHNTSVRDVAAETGVSPAGLYYYFKGKEELLYLILDSCLGPLMERIREEVHPIEEPTLRLRILMRTHLDHFKDNGTKMRVMAREWNSLTGAFGSGIRGLMREYVDITIRTFRQLFPDKSAQELRATAFGMIGMLSWVDQWYRPGRDLPLELLADHYSSIFLEGAPGGGQPRPTSEAKDGESEADWPEKGPVSPILSGPGF